jgi:GNAT superfamily N-acetyltransferase
MQYQLLADRPEAIPIVARWLYEEWGRTIEGNTVEKACERLRQRVSRDNLPLHVLAVENGVIVGFAALKVREMDTYPNREHWLGSVYVPQEQRGHGIATFLIHTLVSMAPRYGVSMLSLQTEREDGGLYRKLGWVPVERVRYHGVDVTVMERHLKAQPNKASDATPEPAPSAGSSAHQG